MASYRSYVSQAQQKPRSQRQRGGGHFYPFFFLLAGFLILLLFYQFVATWLEQSSVALTDKMVVKLEQGGASVTPWGEKEKLALYDNSLILAGDLVDLESDAVLLLQLADGGGLRFGAGAAFVVENKSAEVLELKIMQGRVWYRPAPTTGLKQVKIKGERTEVEMSAATEVDFASFQADELRVFQGEAKILPLIGEEKLTGFTVGVGQQLLLDEEAITALKSGENLNLLQAIDDDYRADEWYRFNVERARASEVMASPAVSTSPAVVTVTSAPVLTPTASPTPSSSAMGTAALSKPLISAPPDQFNTADLQTVIQGTVDKAAAKVQVEHFYEGQSLSKLFLSRYKPGSGVWKYTAVGGANSNLRSGLNTYEVVAFDEQERAGEKATVRINYFPAGLPVGLATAVVPEVMLSEVPPSPSPQTTSVTGFKLAAPAVLTYNGAAEAVTRENNVKIVGTVDLASVRVFVNGFALTGYRGGEKQWVYYAAEKYGTLTKGENRYRVYSVDADGNKSPVTEFVLNKE